MPGTSNFVGEFLVLAGVFSKNVFVAVGASIGVILGAVYAIWLYNRVMYGKVKTDYMMYFADVNRREFVTYVPLLVLVVALGVYPSVLLNTMHLSVVEVLVASIV